MAKVRRPGEGSSVKRGTVPLTACANCRTERGKAFEFHCKHCGWWVCRTCRWLNSRFGAIRGGAS